MAFDYLYSDLPMANGSGIRTPFGTFVLPPGARIAAFVRSGLDASGDDVFLAENLCPTLSAALGRVRAGRGDTVIVLPGHSESVVDALMLTNLVAGTKIIGVGRGSNMPVFRWTATGSQWPITVADVQISGLRLRLEGANGVVKAIVCTAADCLISGCDIETSSGAANLATIAVEFGAGAHRCEFIQNQVRGVAAGVCTDIVKVVGTPDLLRITDNEMFAAATSATGLIHVTTVATNLRIMRNIIANLTAASIAAIGIDNVAATGMVSDCYVSVLATGAHTSNTSGIAMGAAALLRAFQCFSSNDARASGLLQPAVDT